MNILMGKGINFKIAKFSANELTQIQANLQKKYAKEIADKQLAIGGSKYKN